MSFSAGMLGLSAWAFVVSLQMNSLEASGFFGSNFFVLATLIGTCSFALLTTTHAVCLVLRRTIWSNDRSWNNAVRSLF